MIIYHQCLFMERNKNTYKKKFKKKYYSMIGREFWITGTFLNEM